MDDPVELMHAVLDGEASAADAERLERLLDADPASRTHYESLRALHQLLDRVPSVEPPAGLASGIVARIHLPKPITGAQVGGLFLRYGAAFAAGLLFTATLYEFGGAEFRDTDLTTLAGSMASRGEVELVDATVLRTDVAHAHVAGSIATHRRDDLLVLSVSLTAEEGTDLVVPLGGGTRVVGFAGLDGVQATVRVTGGEFRLALDGAHRYAIILQGVGTRIPIEIHRGQVPVHRAELHAPPPG